MLKTKVSYVNNRSSSLKTTVPEGIVEFLKLQVGDKVGWQIDNENNMATMIRLVGTETAVEEEKKNVPKPKNREKNKK